MGYIKKMGSDASKQKWDASKKTCSYRGVKGKAREEGRKEPRKQGRKEPSKQGRKEARKQGRKEARKQGR